MRVTSPPNISNLTELDDVVRYSSRLFDQIISALNGGISADNLQAAVIPFNFAIASTVYPIPHGLGVIPRGYIKIGGPDIRVFDGGINATADNIYVQASGTGTATLLILG